MNINKCKKLCDENDKCKFMYFAKRDANFVCRTYQSCDTFRDVTKAGSTYSKEGKCPGTQKSKIQNLGWKF